MSSTLKPIILYTHKSGPNGWKVALLFEELGIPYEEKSLEFGNGPNGVKHPDFLKINPNGRIPAIVDPNNNDLKVWESAAILQYIQKKYDTENKLGPKNDKEETEILSWLAFQISGLGPSQGQVNWFSHFHAEKIPSAIERYTNETKRCYGVLEERLKEQGNNYIVGGRLTIADMAFFPWVRIADFAGIKMEEDIKRDFPHVYQWYNHLNQLETFKKTYASAQ